MPHDLKGNKLKPGDKVNVPCIVDTVSEDGEGSSGLMLHTVHPIPGSTDTTALCLNTKQVKKSTAKD